MFDFLCARVILLARHALRTVKGEERPIVGAAVVSQCGLKRGEQLRERIVVSPVDVVILRTHACCDGERDLSSLQFIPAVSPIRPTVRQYIVEPCFQQRRAGEPIGDKNALFCAVLTNRKVLRKH